MNKSAWDEFVRSSIDPPPLGRRFLNARSCRTEAAGVNGPIAIASPDNLLLLTRRGWTTGESVKLRRGCESDEVEAVGE